MESRLLLLQACVFFVCASGCVAARVACSLSSSKSASSECCPVLNCNESVEIKFPILEFNFDETNSRISVSSDNSSLQGNSIAVTSLDFLGRTLSRNFLQSVDLNLLPHGISYLIKFEVSAFKVFANTKTLSIKVLFFQNTLPSLGNVMKKLTKLSVWTSSLTSIQPNAFYGLPTLKYLSLYNAGLKTLSGHEFRGLINLATLDLSKNSVDRFNEPLFDDLKKLESLKIGDSRTYEPVFSKKLFCNCIEFRRLYCLTLQTINVTCEYFIRAVKISNVRKSSVLNCSKTPNQCLAIPGRTSRRPVVTSSTTLTKVSVSSSPPPTVRTTATSTLTSGKTSRSTVGSTSATSISRSSVTATRKTSSFKPPPQGRSLPAYTPSAQQNSVRQGRHSVVGAVLGSIIGVAFVGVLIFLLVYFVVPWWRNFYPYGVHRSIVRSDVDIAHTALWNGSYDEASAAGNSETMLSELEAL